MAASRPILKGRYEAIVVGTGIGGLAAAAVLAHEGFEVLLVEQASSPGGCCSSFRDGDFTFDVACSFLKGFGDVGFHVLRTLFDFLGQQVELLRRETSSHLCMG